MKTCQFCAESDLQDEAKICKHCGKSVVDINNNVNLKSAAATRMTTADKFFTYIPFAVGCINFAFGRFEWGGFFFLIAFINHFLRIHLYKKKIIEESISGVSTKAVVAGASRSKGEKTILLILAVMIIGTLGGGEWPVALICSALAAVVFFRV